MFYTSGDLTQQPRNGLGDNYPLMSPEGKTLLLQAIRDGKGFIGIHGALESFTQPISSPNNSSPELLGAESAGEGVLGQGKLVPLDQQFPGMSQLDLRADEPCFIAKNFRSDLHVIAVRESVAMTGNGQQRRRAPIIWARREGKGRVYYTSLGHDEAAWKNPAFRQMLLGAIHWGTGVAEADITPSQP